MRLPRVLVVAGVSSGAGKTTVTLGLLEAFRRRGLAVQAFKVGPDFIDPGLHAVVTGRPSWNLDGWMCGRERVVETVARRSAGADLVLIEGVMGCFGGVDGTSEEGSTAEVARWPPRAPPRPRHGRRGAAHAGVQTAPRRDGRALRRSRPPPQRGLRGGVRVLEPAAVGADGSRGAVLTAARVAPRS